ncbi:hypothetical protein, partial [Morganella morganii]
CNVFSVLLINSVLIKGINIRTNLILPRRIVVYFRKNKKNNKKNIKKKTIDNNSTNKFHNTQ